jgi:hypothetical protein
MPNKKITTFALIKEVDGRSKDGNKDKGTKEFTHIEEFKIDWVTDEEKAEKKILNYYKHLNTIFNKDKLVFLARVLSLFQGEELKNTADSFNAIKVEIHNIEEVLPKDIKDRDKWISKIKEDAEETVKYLDGEIKTFKEILKKVESGQSINAKEIIEKKLKDKKWVERLVRTVLAMDGAVPYLPNSNKAIQNVMDNFHLIKDRIIVSGHDKSEGGLITTLCEMAFAGNKGLIIFVPDEIDNDYIF